ncbi:MAG: tRNA 2-thiouridine(34) synthase MnmA [Sporichthyaceae bacterium]
MRVLAAMSGGVDSAVAAARAVSAGHEVTGVHLALAQNSAFHAERSARGRGCCTPADARDARRCADVLGIPFYVWDFSAEFTESVVEDFVTEYAAGRTPNPCLRCNESIKFAAVLDRALGLGFDAVCTGHYARLLDGPSGRELHRAVDAHKDQSYVLGVLEADQLAHAMFPLGDSLKVAVREEASALGLTVATKPDSHDICFIPDGDTAGFLRSRLGSRPGELVDSGGQVLGTHEGAFGFTIGQRKGLRIGTPAGDGRPRYVLDISPVDSRVTVGPIEALDVGSLRADRASWCGPPLSGGARQCLVQVRAHGEALAATVDAAGAELAITFAIPARGIAPGQAAVLYDGTRVLGSATITSTSSSVKPDAHQHTGTKVT